MPLSKRHSGLTPLMFFSKTTLVCVILFYICRVMNCAHAQNSGPVKTTNQEAVNASTVVAELTHTTVAYKKEVLRLLIAEANDVATSLGLPENLPITQSNLIYVVVGTPKMVELSGGGIGAIDTTNYEYSFAYGRKLSYVTSSKLDSAEARNELEQKYLWPISRRNTNAAYRLATNWLAAIQIDVKRIEHDCRVNISSWTPDGVDEKHFVPLYFVTWKGSSGPVASVELLEPARLLGKLTVEQPEYVLRKPVVITNAEALLSQTNAAVKNAP
jgi:hypothetical protein